MMVWSPARLRMSERVSLICLGSKPAVGSSRISTSGLGIMAWGQPPPRPVALGELSGCFPAHFADVAAFDDVFDPLAQPGAGEALELADEVQVLADAHL